MFAIRQLISDLASVIAPRSCAGCRGDGPEPPAIFCSLCEAKVEPAGHALAVFRYRGPMRRAVRSLKYEGRTSLAVPFGEAVARELERADPALRVRAPLVTAVPLHWTRRLLRGFNQAELIAREVAGRLALEVEPRALSRRRRTRALFLIARDERRASLEGAFVADRRRVLGREVIVVDDIRTSGATLDACAHALLAAGATRVVTIAVAG